ncbi:MAG: class I SAM-dependent methyltransferase [Planctomycetes bacterium]|nr:class I SAM-dependent methyltransferase [Planctomycetota bacterium]
MIGIHPPIASDLAFDTRDLLPTDQALIALGRMLVESGYRFTTITPGAHALVNARPGNAVATDLRDVFGWSRPFRPWLLAPAMLDLLKAADAVEDEGEHLRSRVRFSSIVAGGIERLIMHSAFPTIAQDAVFFGPDTYRFVRLLERVLPGGGDLLELGAGSGAAAICLAPRFASVTMSDINPLAARHAGINAALAGIADVQVAVGDLFAAAPGTYDAIIANPPYMIDATGRWYRDGGGPLGIELALRMVTESLAHLRPGGSFVLYTGSPVVQGADRFHEAVAPLLRGLGLAYAYEELDVDVFSEELAHESYQGIDRIAVVGLTVTLPATTVITGEDAP